MRRRSDRALEEFSRLVVYIKKRKRKEKSASAKCDSLTGCNEARDAKISIKDFNVRYTAGSAVIGPLPMH